MKRTKDSLITIIVLGVVMASFLIGIIAVTNFRNVIDENNHEILLHHCKENSEIMNKRFSEVETLVNALSDYYVEQMDSPDALGEEGFLTGYTEETGKIAYSIARNNPSIVAVYLRLNPEITNPTAGFFISRTAQSSTPVFLEPTDLSKFDPSDVQNVGWYFIPVERGEPVWLEPYENPNNGIYMISYVKPLYIGETLVGVLGIDLDYDTICDKVGGISLYESGYAILMDDSGKILYSGDHNPAISAAAVDKIIAENEDYVYSSYIQRQQFCITTSHKLNNGEYLVLIVPEREIYNTRNQMIFTTILIAIAVSTMVVLVLTGMINRIMNAARIDKLTGAKNRNAYLEKMDSMENAIHAKRHVSFAILIFDINGLKAVNDTFGHAEGDKLIINSYQAIKGEFPHVEIYRIGGDEFVIIMEKRTVAIAEKLAAEFRAAMAEKSSKAYKQSGEAIVSCGWTLYDPQTDASYEDTFHRADKDMYQDKERFYRANPHLKRRG